MEIIEVTNNKLRKQFIDFPHDLYANDAHYVPELYIGQKELLSTKKNPFFKHSKLSLFLAKKGNQFVGRIAAIRNNNHNEYHDEQVAFFGCFDVIEDYEVATALLDTAVDWAKKESLNGVVGPANISSNDPWGMLVDGFEDSPYVMMTYNKPYYKDFVEKYGFKKKMDLLAYTMTPENSNKRSIRLANAIEERLKRKNIVVRCVNIKLVIDPDFVYVAEHNGEAIGFSLTLPDINQIVKTMKKGRLLPFGIFKLLFQKKKINRVRVITLGVVEDYRKMGIEAVFYAKNIQTALDKKIKSAEASWVLEDNSTLNKAIVDLNATVNKRYRVFNLNFNNVPL